MNTKKAVESEEDQVDELDANKTVDRVREKKSSVKKKETVDDEFFEEWEKPDNVQTSFTGFNLDRKLLKVRVLTESKFLL